MPQPWGLISRQPPLCFPWKPLRMLHGVRCSVGCDAARMLSVHLAEHWESFLPQAEPLLVAHPGSSAWGVCAGLVRPFPAQAADV